MTSATLAGVVIAVAKSEAVAIATGAETETYMGAAILIATGVASAVEAIAIVKDAETIANGTATIGTTNSDAVSAALIRP